MSLLKTNSFAFVIFHALNVWTQTRYQFKFSKKDLKMRHSCSKISYCLYFLSVWVAITHAADSICRRWSFASVYIRLVSPCPVLDLTILGALHDNTIYIYGGEIWQNQSDALSMRSFNTLSKTSRSDPKPPADDLQQEIFTNSIWAIHLLRTMHHLVLLQLLLIQVHPKLQMGHSGLTYVVGDKFSPLKVG